MARSLFEPANLGPLRLKNRFVMAPMTTYSSKLSGEIAEDELPYLRRRAEGGFGAVMTAACCVHPFGRAFEGQWACWDDSFIPSLKSAADAIHEGGSLAILQIHHGGRTCPSSTSPRILAPSAIPMEREGAEMPIAMTEEDILTAIQAFADAARRGAEAGFDGIEIHGANTYLLQQFVSPGSNQRDDEWGKDRLKFSRMVVEGVLAAVPETCGVGYRFSPEEAETPGLRWQDTEALLKMLTEYPLAYAHISLRHFDQPSLYEDSPDNLVTKTLKALDGKLPLISVGSIRYRSEAEEALAAGAEALAIGRVALTDPEVVHRIEQDVEPELRYPRQGGMEELTIPLGLNAKILKTSGWIPLRD